MEIGGRMLPAGATVAPCIYLVHRRADIYPDPHAFRPERWLEQSAGTYTWFPFGGGMRRCLGASFALRDEGRALGLVSRVDLRAARPAPRAPGAPGDRVRALNGAGDHRAAPGRAPGQPREAPPRPEPAVSARVGPPRRGGRRDRAGGHQQVELRAHAASAQAPAHAVAPDGQHAARPPAPGHAHPAALRALAEPANAPGHAHSGDEPEPAESHAAVGADPVGPAPQASPAGDVGVFSSKISWVTASSGRRGG